MIVIIIEIEYSELACASRTLSKASSYCREYASSLQKKVPDKLNTLTRGSSTYTSSASYFVSAKIKSLESQQQKFLDVSGKINDFIEEAKNTDQRVANLMKREGNIFRKANGLSYGWIDGLMQALTRLAIGESNEEELSRWISACLRNVSEEFSGWMLDFKHWYTCKSRKYEISTVFEVVGLIVPALAALVTTLPPVVTICTVVTAFSWLTKLLGTPSKDTKTEIVVEAKQVLPEELPIVYVHTNENYNFPINRAYRATPKKTNASGFRKADAYIEVLSSFDVENTKRYQKNNGNTYCNIYVWDVTSAMGCEIPHWVDSSGAPADVGAPGARELSAAGVRDWLGNHGEDYGWIECSKEEAILMANAGNPTVACDTAGNHVAMVAPQYDGETGVQISQAGASNYNHTSINRGWGRSYTLKYYYHR